MILSRKITVKETYPLRHKLLRPHQTIEHCHFAGDNDKTTAHFGAFLSDKLIGILSIYQVDTPKVDLTDGWQLRAMAVEEEHRRKGYALALLKEAEAYAVKSGAGYVWANAREIAVGFYLKAGYQTVGEIFDIPNVGLHYFVYKQVKETVIEKAS